MDALRHIKRITGQRKKIGHGGTIDPLASGVLPICFGRATRLMDHIVDSGKLYRAEITLGISTATYDAEGEIIKSVDFPDLTRQMVENSIRPWIGLVNQTPPMYSAIKVGGNRLYKLARAGLEVKREARVVKINEIRILEFDYPKLVIEVDCGKGTYIRSLAHDLGESLGCGGHIADLVRLVCGNFFSEKSVTLEELEQASESPEGWQKYLYPIDWVLMNLESITLGSQAEKQLHHGQALSLDTTEAGSEDQEERRAYNTQGIFIGLVKFDRSTGTWQPVKVFQSDNTSPYTPNSR